MDDSFREYRLRAALAVMDVRNKLNQDTHDKRLVELMSRIAAALEKEPD